ncbi:hypothetical protein SPF06_19620 [Sinomonas sp. JGH33]|uniref:Uncharacterized protein n=1 Tax=Sinomonas terricola TaxID=3110330 RepID=A0ABU5TB71_9MICC|nr:hypothetical protein [Sinomonas sp. JGH33]MEA5456937.1 hypothetical protein [Sinomonas sp. JGH33]
MTSDLEYLSMRIRDDFNGTQAGHDPWFAVRLMRSYEERERDRGEDSEPPLTDECGDAGREG